MQPRGLRPLLQPILYVGIAGLVHGLVFLIPLRGGTGRPDSQTTRGVRVRAFVAAPETERPLQVPSTPEATIPPPPPVMERNQSSAGSDGAPAGGSPVSGSPSGTPGQTGSGATTAGGISDTGAREGAIGKPAGEFGQYLAKLRSDGVQGWAKESSKSIRQGWRGSGSGAGTGWGQGSGSGSGSGSGGGGGGKGSGGGAAYLDPRVQMVVTSYPQTGIESRFSQVPYPDLKIKKARYVSGWWNVYIKVFTDSYGKVTRMDVLRPESDGELERIFVEKVKKEISRWTFDPVDAQIHVDVRFHVE